MTVFGWDSSLGSASQEHEYLKFDVNTEVLVIGANSELQKLQDDPKDQGEEFI